MKKKIQNWFHSSDFIPLPIAGNAAATSGLFSKLFGGRTPPAFDGGNGVPNQMALILQMVFVLDNFLMQNNRRRKRRTMTMVMMTRREWGKADRKKLKLKTFNILLEIVFAYLHFTHFMQQVAETDDGTVLLPSPYEAPALLILRKKFPSHLHFHLIWHDRKRW